MAALLAGEPDLSVIGVDVVAPEVVIPGMEFVRADIRNPLIAKVMGEARVDTVVHMGVIATPKEAGSRSTMKEINVIGTMQLLAACQRHHQCAIPRREVHGSGVRVWSQGSGPVHRGHGTQACTTSGWAKDCLEVETYVRGFARRRPDVSVATLRFANFIGPRVQTAMTAYFSLPIVPTVLGFDPRLQFVHEDDGLAALRCVVLSPRAGTFNIAGDGVVMLSQAVRRSRRTTIAVPSLLFAPVGRGLSARGLADFSPEAVRYLTYGRAVDTHAMRGTLGFNPAWTSEEAFISFLQRHDEVEEVRVA